jgi:hypothetical protein
MNILILEDDMSRMEQFEKNLSDHHVVHAETAELTIELLTMYEWDWLFLDHDLGGETMVDSFITHNTGYAVASWLEQNVDHMPSRIIIHSFNPTGADNIHKALPDAVKLPGAWMYTLETIEKGVGHAFQEIR